ncbi:hypothetical protein MMC30_006812 [Trapelia coarctata]|nr:hypothetical protein [Trapelia coarctata]
MSSVDAAPSDQHSHGKTVVQDWPLNPGSQCSLSRDISREATTIRASREEKRNNAHEPAQPSVGPSSETQVYPGPLSLSLLTIGICLSVFLVSLDRTIIAQVSNDDKAIPKITDDFNSYDDVGWYGSAYLITASALQPTYGRIFQDFNVKWSFLIALVVFEIGSLICAVAPNSTVLVVGRAIAGWGSAGILTGSFVVVAHSVPLQKRPVYTAAVGVMFGVGAFVGPILGGVFTERTGWRWCFYFNLPVGAVTFAAMLLFFKPPRMASNKASFLKKVLGLDLMGNLLFLGAAVMFFLALQLNESGYSWASSTVIGLLVGSGVTTVVFIAWQWHRGDRALIPPRIVLQRSVAASVVAAFFIYGTMLIHAYYLPIWFQAVKGDSAISSGVSMVAYMLANALFSLLAGAIVSKVGYFTPPAIVGSAVGVVGCGLLSTFQVDTPAGKWIGYQILVSAGLGIAIQQGFIAVQTVLSLDQVSIGVAAIVCFQSLGGAVFVSVGNSILQNGLLNAGTSNKLPGIDIQAVITAGATQFRSIVPPDALPALLVAYNAALQKVFMAAIPLSGMAFVAALGLEWKSVREKKSNLEASQESTSRISAVETLGAEEERESVHSERKLEKTI